jgi:hypothetical protein
MMRVRLVVERPIDDEVGLLEPFSDVADRPLDVGLAVRQSRSAGRGERVGGPLLYLDHVLGRLARLRRRVADDHVAVAARVRAARSQAVERVERERKRLEVDLDLLDGIGCDPLAVGGDGEDRLPLEQRFVGDAGLVQRIVLGEILLGEDRVHAGHRERRRRVDLAHPAVRHRRQHALREQHAVGAPVLGVAGTPGDLGVVVGRRVVGAVIGPGHLSSPPHYGHTLFTYSAARIALLRILL